METNQAKKALAICSFILISLISNTLQAQNGFKKPISESNLYIQPNVGFSQYYGDFNEKKYWNPHPGFAFGAVLGYHLNPIFGFRGQFLKTNLNSESAIHNIVFRSNLWDGSLNLTLNINEILAKYYRKYNENVFFKYYLFTGVGMSSFKSKLNDLETGELIDEHSDRHNVFSLPIGAGVVYRVNNIFSIIMEYSDHTIFGGTTLDFTDYAKPNNEHYSYVSAGLQIRVGNKDTDNDGVNDKKDMCPRLYGKVKLAGCPDNDNDGIADKDDACPDVAGSEKYEGCPDKDGDGVIDREDYCPNVAGKPQVHGCPDKDDDGVADKDDRCPDVSGKKELAGCPDADGDGIIDSQDSCMYAPGKKELAGCPDRDGDGIADKNDSCPDIRGLAVFAGCPDTDNDGIIDSQDSCVTESGKTFLNGCPDSDNDSIADKDDKCPQTYGKKKLAGCPDRDNDGIADIDDTCPDIKGPVKFDGCPDTDGDGVPDNKDKCPKVAGIAGNYGCPGVKNSAAAILKKTIYFGSGSSEFMPTFGNTISLDEIIAFLKENPEAEISVAGYEDGIETQQHSSIRLSEKRADYVINSLKQKGVKSVKIKKSYHGKNKPVANNTTAEGRSLNRRVEIKIIK